MTEPNDAVSPPIRVVAPRGLPGALLRFRVMAFVTGVVLAVMSIALLVISVAGATKPAWYGLGWMAHGWLYVAYVVVALDLVFRLRWHLVRALLILLAGTVPFMSFVAERYVTHRVRPIVDATAGAGASEVSAARRG